MNINNNIRTLVGVSALALAIAACSSIPKNNTVVESARHTYERATQDITLVRHAADELDRAKFALTQAEHHLQRNQRTDAEHYAYVATQRVRIAELVAEAHESQQEAADMVDERRKLTLDIREAELEKNRRETAMLQRRMELLEADNTKRGMMMTLGDITFEPGTAILSATSTNSIDKVVLFLNTYPERELIIEGHTDSKGDARINLKLSRSRAISVREALIEKGVDGSRITTHGYGESIPIANNRSVSGRRQNRRVELIFPNPPTQLVEFDE